MYRRTFLAAAGLMLARPALAQGTALRIGLITPPAHQWSKSAAALAARLAERTQGAVALSVLPAGQLGSESQMLQQLQAWCQRAEASGIVALQDFARTLRSARA